MSVNNKGNKYNVFNNLIEGVQVVNPNWEYIYVNDSVVKQSRMTREELVGSTMMERFPGIEKTEMFSHLQKCMTDWSRHVMINEFTFPNKSKGWFEISLQAVPEGVLIFSSDVTKLKKTEAKLRERLDERIKMVHQLEEQKRSLEEFTQIIAHNLRSPLSNLLLLSDLVDKSNSQDEKQMFIEKIKPIIDFLHETFEELVDATQIRRDYLIKSDRINLEKYLTKVLNLYNVEISKFQIELTWNFSKAKIVYFPKKYFESILSNLVSNAIKYKSDLLPPKIHIHSFVKEGWIHLEVKDNGLGINLTKYGDKLFKLHKTFHNNPNAKGFGLFITKTQVEAMGGSIKVKSIPGTGSSFILKLCKSR
jgi:PAS domain S-box-containing protein